MSDKKPHKGHDHDDQEEPIVTPQTFEGDEPGSGGGGTKNPPPPRTPNG